MKITLGEIIKAVPVLNRLANEPMPVPESYKLAKLMKKLGTEYEIYDRERIKLLEQYGVKTADGKRYDISDEGGWNNAYGELIAQETEVDFEPVRICEAITISANELSLIESFIEI